MTSRRNVRAAAAVLVSAAALVALAASGSTSNDSGRTDTGSSAAQSDSAQSNGEDNKPAKPSGPSYTPSQQNAINAAEDYLSMSGFSKKGLIEQLSSSAGDGYPHKDAVFAVAHLHVDWNKQAVRSATDYLHTSSFSCQGLTDQLSSSAGDRYTQEQAQYAAKKVGLC